MANAKRHAYKASLKLKAIEYAVVHGNRAAAKHFNVNESMVRKWRKQEDALRQVKKNQLSFRGHKARWPQLEDRIEQWVIGKACSLVKNPCIRCTGLKGTRSSSKVRYLQESFTNIFSCNVFH